MTSWSSTRTTGRRSARLTTDGPSFAPEWSPNGDQIAYLHADGLDVDVRVMTLDLAGNLTLHRLDQAVTVDGNVDPASTPAWFIPADQRVAFPRPAPAPETPSPDAPTRPRRGWPAASDEAATLRDQRSSPALAIPGPPGAADGRRPAPSLCLGIDPDPDALPDGLPAHVSRASGGSRELVLDAAGPFAAAVKVNVAFFERWGSDGVRALERLRAAVPADLPFIADAKRGDIGSTAAQYADALYDALGADAVTASPYLGAEAIAPLLDRPDRFVYLLCRTSNPGARRAPGPAWSRPTPRRERPRNRWRCASRAWPRWARHPGTVGLVVGATAPAELAAVRAIAPGLPFLVPGVGTQGGDAGRRARARPGRSGPAARPPAGRCWSTCRAASRAPRSERRTPERRSRAAQAWAATLRVLG